MSSSCSLCGIILAAGKSTRMGTDKALLTWPPAAPGTVASAAETFLSALIVAFRPFVKEVIVVAGENAANLAPVVSANCASLVRNPAPERGQFSSLQIGLNEVLARGFDAAMITPVDCPPLSAASLQRLLSSFEEVRSRGQWAIAPENNGKHGHPLLASYELIDAFLRAAPTSNAREVKRENSQFFEYVSVPDLLVSAGVNTQEEYAALSIQVSLL